MDDAGFRVKRWSVISVCVGMNVIVMILLFWSFLADLNLFSAGSAATSNKSAVNYASHAYLLIPLIISVLGLAGIWFKNRILVFSSILFSLLIGLFYLLGVLAVFLEGPLSLNSDVMHILLPALFIGLNGLALTQFRRSSN